MLGEFLETLEKVNIPYDLDRRVDKGEAEIVVDLLAGNPVYRVIFMFDEESGNFKPSGWGEPGAL